MSSTMCKTATFLSLSAGLVFGATQAFAHAALVRAEPAVNASVATPANITLHFNEALEARVSSFKLTDVDGKEVAVAPAAAPDAKSISAKPAAALAAGLYTVSWTAVGDDGHPTKGTFSFTVK
jgi:methionine-rich copper-binding protein CopC